METEVNSAADPAILPINYKISVVAIIVKDNKYVLIGKRKGGRGSGLFAFPGGHLESGESFRACASREVREETGLDIAIEDIEDTGLVHNDVLPGSSKYYEVHFMRARYKGGEAKNLEPERCEELGWHEWHNLPRPLFPGIQKLIEIGYSPIGRENC